MVYEADKRRKVLRKTTEMIKVRVTWLSEVVYETHPAPFANERYPWTWHDAKVILLPLDMDDFGAGSTSKTTVLTPDPRTAASAVCFVHARKDQCHPIMF